MANPKEPRLVKWRGYWYVFAFDWTAGKPSRVPCSKYNANTKAERTLLIRRLREKDLREHAASTHLIGGNEFKLKLSEAFQRYRIHIDELVKERAANPEVRSGLSPKEGHERHLVVTMFLDWLGEQGLSSLPCERLNAVVLNRFFGWIISTPYNSGSKGKQKMRSAVTVNNYRRRLGTCLRWLDLQRPRLFPDFVIIAPALKSRPVSSKPSLAFTPDELGKFLVEAGKPAPKANVKRFKNGRNEVFKQGAAREASTSVDSLFLLLACTGMRLGEALSLRWSDMDFDSGRIIIKAQKTGSWRMIPLTSAPECEVAPSFLKLLKRWRKERPDSIYVLPHEGIEKPAYPKHAWQRTRKTSGSDITPQKLRQNFVSYCASMGVPPAVAAMWCGHSAQVAERHYRLQLMGRKKARSIQGAMGL